MSKKIKKIIYALSPINLLVLFSVFALPAAAIQRIPDTNITSVDTLYGRFVYIMNVIFSFAIVLAVILIIFGGISYMTAGGEDEKLKTAKKRIIWGLVGAAIVIAAWGLIALIAQYLGAGVVKPQG